LAAPKHITVFVSNDLTHDQRVAKVCDTLLSMGHTPTLAGRLLPESVAIERPYRTRRFRLPFRSGFLFYASLNLRLLWFALFVRSDALLANDLDTLPAAFVAARLRRKKLFYDSHEYFTEAEGLTGHPVKKRIWLRIEKWILPRLDSMITVNESIAAIYRRLYNIPVHVVRNVPPLRPLPPLQSRNELGLPEHKRIIILQGAYIDPDRGAREAVSAMEYVDGAVLLIAGAGRDLEAVKKMANAPALSGKVLFRDKMPFDMLQQYTRHASAGLSLDKPVHLNYTYSLPNKIFDYVHAGIPVVVSPLPEMEKLLADYAIGFAVKEVTPAAIAACLNQLLSMPEGSWSSALARCAAENNWQRESEVLRRCYTW
jgi:glycosyltransferase involved in cell wall biosynthesis